MTLLRIILAITLVVATAGAGLSTTINVPSEQPTIQTGINVAVNGDTVLVANGTYTGDENRDIDFTGKAIVVMSENGPDVTIIDCEGSPVDSHRGFYFHSGENANSVVQGFTIKNGYAHGDWPQDVGGAIYCGDSSSPTIRGNTITGNEAENGGGAIYCGDSSSPIITGNTITGNASYYWGGGIYCTQSSPTITGNTITGNTSERSGSGILCTSYSSPRITDNTVTGNMSLVWGAGIWCYAYSSPDISGNTVSENAFGGIYCVTSSSPTITGNTITDNGGSGISCSSSSSPTIEDNTITGNVNETWGGGIHCMFDASPTITGNTIKSNVAGVGGGGIACRESSPTITDNIISGNTANSYGGGIYCSNSSPSIRDNTISENLMADGGDGIYCGYNSTPTITGNTIIGNDGSGIVSEDNLTIDNNIITGNNGRGIVCRDSSIIGYNTIAGNNGGGIACGKSSMITGNKIVQNDADKGGGILCQDGSLYLYCNTIIENTANDGGGVYCLNSTVDVTNTIFYGNDALSGEEICLVEYSDLTINYSDVDGWLEGVYLDYGSSLSWGSGMIEADPMFVLAEKQDYRFLWGSLCIDAGHPDSADVDGTVSDIGAHFYDQDDYITLYITPDTTEVEPGGQLGVTYTVINRWSWEQPFWLQSRIATPGGGSRNVFEPIEYTMLADSTVQVHINHDIPVAIPEGTYEYLSRNGIPPEMLYDLDSFYFTINQ
jgi:parallel beta-helix repeat protein